MEVLIAEVLRWDPSVSLGSLVTAGVMFVGIIAAAVWMKADIRQATFNLADVKTDVSELKSVVDQMRPAVNRTEVIVAQLADGKERMDRLDKEILRLRDHLHDLVSDLRHGRKPREGA